MARVLRRSRRRRLAKRQTGKHPDHHPDKQAEPKSQAEPNQGTGRFREFCDYGSWCWLLFVAAVAALVRH